MTNIKQLSARCQFTATRKQIAGGVSYLVNYICDRPAKYETVDGKYCCGLHRPEADRIAKLNKQPLAVAIKDTPK